MREKWALSVAFGAAMRKQRVYAGMSRQLSMSAALEMSDGHLAAIESGHRLICEDHALVWCMQLRDYVKYDKFMSLLCVIRALEHIRRRGGSPRDHIQRLSRVDLPLASLLRTLEPLVITTASDPVYVKERAPIVLIEHWRMKTSTQTEGLLGLPRAA